MFTLFRYTIEKKIDENFEKKIAEHKYELQSIRDAATFDYQRKMHDFSIYSSNRHSIYNELYQKVLVATKSIELLSVIPLKTDNLIPSSQIEFEDMLYFREYEFRDGEQDAIEKLWEKEDHVSLSTAIIRLEKRKRTKDARDNYGKLSVTFLENELFLSDEVSRLTRELIDKVTLFAQDYIKGISDEEAKIRYEAINNIHEEIKKNIKNELSIGFYSND